MTVSTSVADSHYDETVLTGSSTGPIAESPQSDDQDHIRAGARDEPHENFSSPGLPSEFAPLDRGRRKYIGAVAALNCGSGPCVIDAARM